MHAADRKHGVNARTLLVGALVALTLALACGGDQSLVGLALSDVPHGP
jgi:hypothetical protein